MTLMEDGTQTPYTLQSHQPSYSYAPLTAEPPRHR